MPIASADRDRSRAGIRSLAAVVCAALGTVGTPVSADTGREVYVIDPAASQVRVHLGRAGLLKFMGHDHEIDAPIARGRIEVDPDEPMASLVDLSWDPSLLAIVPGSEPEEDVPAVEERMRGPEVLDVVQHGEIRFWSFEIEVQQADPEAGRWQLLVRGGLQIKGARHTVEVPLVVRRQGDGLTAAGEAKLRLRHLGIDPPSVAGVVKVADEFRLAFDVRAFREGEAGEGVSDQVR